MNRDQFEDYQIEEASTKSNTDSSSSLDFSNPAVRRPSSSQRTYLSMTNTRRAIMNNPHFASVAKELRPNCFDREKREHQQYDSEKKEGKQDKEEVLLTLFMQENPQSTCPNLFSGTTERNFTGFKPTGIFENRFKPNWEVQKLVNYKPTIKAFDIRSNPFNFFGSTKDQEKSQ